MTDTCNCPCHKGIAILHPVPCCGLVGMLKMHKLKISDAKVRRVRVVGLALLIGLVGAVGHWVGWEKYGQNNYRAPMNEVVTVFIVVFVITLAIGFWARREEIRKRSASSSEWSNGVG